MRIFDFDGDGRLDTYLVNSYTVDAALVKRPRAPAPLYRNLGNGTFVDQVGKLPPLRRLEIDDPDTYSQRPDSFAAK